MKKIIYIITDYGSFNNFLGEAAIALIREGYEVSVICSENKIISISDKYSYTLEGVNFYYVNFPRGFNPISHYKSSKSIHRIVRGINPDVISLHFSTGIFTSTFISRFSCFTLGTFHGLGYPVIDGWIKKKIYKFVEERCVNRLDEVWVLNNLDKEVLKSDFPEIKCEVLPTKGLGCDLKRFNLDNFPLHDQKSIMNSLGIKSSDFNLCFTGRFVHFKGFDKVIRGFRLLLEEFGVKNINLILIGGIDPAHKTGLNKEETAWYLNCPAVKKTGMTSFVENYLSVTDLFVFPSEKEGIPVCIIEALAMGVPVLTANSRGCNDLIENGKNGVILCENKEREIAKIINLLMNDSNKMVHFKENIKQMRWMYDRQLFVQDQVNYFNSID